jgi:pimeloyl-ACP methyl ester carboxylesterase
MKSKVLLLFLVSAIITLLAQQAVFAGQQQESRPAVMSNSSNFPGCDLTTKYVEVEGLRIAYYETKGWGPTIVLIPGKAESKDSYKKQLLSPLGWFFRMVSFDLPGHGESDKAIDPFQTYSVQQLTKILLGIVDKLNLHDAVFVGCSFSGHMLLEVSSQLPQAKGFMIFGAPPIGFPASMDAFFPIPAFFLGYKPDLTEEEVNVLTKAYFKPNAAIPQFFFDDVRESDGMFRLCVGYMFQTGGYKDEIEIVRHLSVPLAVIHGKEDQLINGDYYSRLEMPTLWRNKVHIIAKAGHNVQWERADMFNLLLMQFAFQVNW